MIEVKATTESNARMSVRQAETAAKQKERFVLCIVRLARPEVVEDDVRNGARFVFNIGSLIEPLWNSFSSLESEKNKSCKRNGDIEMEMQESNTRFRVGKDTWATGMSFDDAVKFLKAKLGQPETSNA